MDLDKDTKVIDQDQRIAAYLKGQLSEEEERQFLSALEHDVQLRAQAIAIARMVNAMRIVGSEKDKTVVALMKQLGCEEKVKAKLSTLDYGCKAEVYRSSLLRKIAISLSVAASLLCCIWGGYRLYDNHQMVALGTEYLAYFPSTEYSRGDIRGVDEVQSSIANLQHSVEAHDDMESSIEELDNMWKQSLQDEYNEYTEYSSQIGWILANAYIIQNDKAQALRVLDAIIASKDSTPALQNKAMELKKKVKNTELF